MDASDILKAFNLKKTSCRKAIIDAMLKEQKPLSEHEIRNHLMNDFDRTTFYRAFKTLEQHRVIHKIVLDKQEVKYALGYQQKQHIHFYCHLCHNVQCIDTKQSYSFSLPEGFIADETEVLIKGICEHCHKADS